jgi:hypothetical protein
MTILSRGVERKMKKEERKKQKPGAKKHKKCGFRQFLAFSGL